KGVEIDNRKRSAIQNSLHEIKPLLPVAFYPVEVSGKAVWVMEVDSGKKKPYVLSGAIYVRQGANTQKLTTVEQMREFFQQSNRIYFDEAPCPSFALPGDIDLEWFQEFRIEAGLSKAISRIQIIENLKLIDSDNTIKNGAVLFFAKKPRKFIESALIRCTAFEGNNRIEIIDNKYFGGPLIKQYRQSMQWLKERLNIRYDIQGGGPRKELW